MRTFRISCALAMALAASPALAGDTGWSIHGNIADAEGMAKANSKSVGALKDADIENRMVYGTAVGRGPMLPLYDMIACIELSNPASSIDVRTGKAVDVTVRKAAFPGGTWDTKIRIGEKTEFRELDKRSELVLQRVKVGTLEMNDKKDWIHAIRWLTRSCRDGEPRKKATLEEKVMGKPPR